MASLDEPHQRHLRKLVISCILATDMGLHAEILGNFTTRLVDPRPFEMSGPYQPPGPNVPDTIDVGVVGNGIEGGQENNSSSQYLGNFGEARNDGSLNMARKAVPKSGPPLSSSGDVVLFLQMIIKCADLSNVIKPFFLSKRWSALLCLEWFRQGDIEKELGMNISKFMDREDPTTLMFVTLHLGHRLK